MSGPQQQWPAAPAWNEVANGRTTGDATVVLESDGGVRERVVLSFVEEDGTWRPCP